MQPEAKNKKKNLLPTRIWNKSKRAFENPPFILSIILLVVLFYLVVVPLISMVQSSFTLHPRDALYVSDKKPGDFTD